MNTAPRVEESAVNVGELSKMFRGRNNANNGSPSDTIVQMIFIIECDVDNNNDC